MAAGIRAGLSRGGQSAAIGPPPDEPMPQAASSSASAAVIQEEPGHGGPSAAIRSPTDEPMPPADSGLAFDFSNIGAHLGLVICHVSLEYRITIRIHSI